MVEQVGLKGLPIAILRPGNMAGSPDAGAQNPDDFVFIFLSAILQVNCSPTNGTDYFLDLTPVDFAASAVAHLVVEQPRKAIGQKVHLQNSADPVRLAEVVSSLRQVGHEIHDVTVQDFLAKVRAKASEERAAARMILMLKILRNVSG